VETRPPGASLRAREKQVEQRERELAEQRRVLEEEYRLLRESRPAAAPHAPEPGGAWPPMAAYPRPPVVAVHRPSQLQAAHAMTNPFDGREATLWQRVRRVFAELSSPLGQRS
jgi:hypothetical protein